MVKTTELMHSPDEISARDMSVALLTGGADRPYIFGLVDALLAHGVKLDLIGSDDLDFPEFRNSPGLNFLNLRGSQRPESPLRDKVIRVLVYYARLIQYAVRARPRIFHIIWNNKFETFDRTLLMLYYRLLGKRIAFTVHNVNAGIRDLNDSFLNRLTLRIQYRLCAHLFVHTEKMKLELTEGFAVPAEKVAVIPFGINNAVPNTELTREECRHRIGIAADKKTILFFGNITSYKGIEYLVSAFQRIADRSGEYQLIIAGQPDRSGTYWADLEREIREKTRTDQVVIKATFVPDEETEVYFKAADVLVLPYKHVYQSGVLFLGYSFGLPVIAADVGSLRDDIVEGETGFLFKPESSEDLTAVLERYFSSDLYENLQARRACIQAYAEQRHSWQSVAQITTAVYEQLLKLSLAETSTEVSAANQPLDLQRPS